MREREGRGRRQAYAAERGGRDRTQKGTRALQPTEMASTMPERASVSPGGCRQKVEAAYRVSAAGAPEPFIETHAHAQLAASWLCRRLHSFRSARRQALKPIACQMLALVKGGLGTEFE